MIVVLHMLLRAKKVILLSFCIIFGLLLVLLAMKPDKYEAHMSFFFRNELAENLISADPAQKALRQQNENETEEKINSEIELLGSTDLLQAVVVDTGLDKEFLNSSGSNRPVAMDKATRKLSKRLLINGIRRSSIIEITYTSSNRDEAKRVLDSLSKQYFSQYAKLHNVGGAAMFYKSHSEALASSLQKAENDRAALLTQNGYMLLPEGQHLGLAQIVDLQRARNEAETSLAETESRLRSVVAQQAASSDRLLTQKKVAANPASVEQLNTKLADLQNRHTELRTKFVDDDPLLTQVQQEITDTRSALAEAQGMRSEDVTTDVNPIRQSLDGQANQLNQTKAGLISRLAEIRHELAQQKGQLDGMEKARIDLSNLDRNIKVLQESVDLYRSKALVATAAEEMDPEQFSNVVEATHPTVPVLPTPSRFNGLSSFALALVLSLGIGAASEWRKRAAYANAGRAFSIFETAHSN